MTPQPRLDAVGVHNRVLRAASRRIDELETQLADALLPILERAGAQAAAGFQRTVTNHLTAAAVDGVTSLSTMLAVKPRPDEAAALALADGTPPETLHVTLAYLGEVEGDLGAVAEALRPVAASYAPLEGVVGGAGFFAPNPEGVGPAILLPDVPGLVELRVAATEALAAAGIDYARLHGFTAHLTVAYFDGDGNVVGEGAEGGPVDDPRPLFGSPLHFDALLVVRGDVVEAEFPLVGRPPLTAAADPVPGAARQVERAEAALREALAGGDPEQVRQAKLDLKDARGLLYDAVRGPQWSSPAPDEVIDADALARAFRTKTDPVRQALLQATMTPALKAAGLEFDLANPLAAKVLAQSGSQVVEIARTTQLNVMRIIRASHDQGLSIPDTARAIQAGMKDAAPARALLIARTELSGAVNGGSLAATRIVSDATGETYVKRWMTAPGAPNPRHELYEGLDGQTVGLEDPFDVGGDALMFPGDPDGSPEEVCNCRCTVVYDTPSGEQEVSDGETPDAGVADTSGGSPDSAGASAVADQMASDAADLEPQTTADLSAVARQAGGRMAGLEFAVKTRASLERKIASDMADAVKAGENPSVAEVAGTINDALRYTMTFPEASYTRGVQHAIKRLGKAGYEPVKVKNYWGNADYQGVNAVFAKDGHRLELQFHTPRTFELKTELHPQYEAFRTSSDPVERARLWAEMASEQSRNAVPPDALSIGQRVAHEAPPDSLARPPSGG